MNIGRIIKVIRAFEGIDQRTLAARMGVTRTYMSQIETGRKEPSLSFLKAFSKKFNIPLPLLFIGEENGNEEIREILKKVLISHLI